MGVPSGPEDEPITAVRERLRAQGRAYEVRDAVLVLDSGVAQRLDDLAFAYAGLVGQGMPPEAAAGQVVASLEQHESHLREVGGRGSVRLRLTHPREVDPTSTLPGPAGLVAYLVLDEPHAATRLTPAQVADRGGLEAAGVAALGPTLAEPVHVQAFTGPPLPGWRVTGDIYTASRLLDCARLLRELGADPSRPHLVAVPSSRELWVFPDPADPAALAWVREQVSRSYAAARGRVSDAVHRWDGTVLEVVAG